MSESRRSLAEVNGRSDDIGLLDPQVSAHAVFRVVVHHLPAGGIDKIAPLLPDDTRRMFDAVRQELQ